MLPIFVIPHLYITFKYTYYEHKHVFLDILRNWGAGELVLQSVVSRRNGSRERLSRDMFVGLGLQGYGNSKST
jgi:hypothetical protein